jgi:hypothetical protein
VILLLMTAVFSVFLLYPVVRRRAEKPVETP